MTEWVYESLQLFTNLIPNLSPGEKQQQEQEQIQCSYFGFQSNYYFKSDDVSVS